MQVYMYRGPPVLSSKLHPRNIMWPGDLADMWKCCTMCYSCLSLDVYHFLTFLNLYEFKYTLEIINLLIVRGVLCIYLCISLCRILISVYSAMRRMDIHIRWRNWGWIWMMVHHRQIRNRPILRHVHFSPCYCITVVTVIMNGIHRTLYVSLASSSAANTVNVSKPELLRTKFEVRFQ